MTTQCFRRRAGLWSTHRAAGRWWGSERASPSSVRPLHSRTMAGALWEDMHTCRSPGTTMAAGTLPAECRCLVYFPKKLAPGSPDFLSGPLVRSVEDEHGGVGGSPSHLLGLYSVLDPQPRRGLSVPS